MAVVVGLFVMAVSRTKIVVGNDGLLFSWCGSTRFLAYAEIRLVRGVLTKSSVWNWDKHQRYDGIEIHLANGEEVRFWTLESREVYMTVREAVDAWWGRDGSVKASLVERGTRDVRGWIATLRNIGSHATAGYRNLAIADELWRIVEDLAAPPDARAGAAVALQPSLGAEGRARLQRVAEVTAQPKLRIAIERAASSEEEAALMAALAEIESASAHTVKAKS